MLAPAGEQAAKLAHEGAVVAAQGAAAARAHAKYLVSAASPYCAQALTQAQVAAGVVYVCGVPRARVSLRCASSAVCSRTLSFRCAVVLLCSLCSLCFSVVMGSGGCVVAATTKLVGYVFALSSSPLIVPSPVLTTAAALHMCNAPFPRIEPNATQPNANPKPRTPTQPADHPELELNSW